jgi:hypothetical protein
LIVANQNGINTTNSMGINYSNNWQNKFLLSASYLFNNSTNQTETTTDRIYFQNNNLNQQYHQKSNGSTSNYNHRFTGRVEWKVDSFNSIIIVPRISLQDNLSNSVSDGKTTIYTDSLLNSRSNKNQNQNKVLDYNSTITFRHRFRKVGRTLSLELNSSYNNKENPTSLYSENKIFNSTASGLLLNQSAQTNSYSYNISPNIAYTEALTKKSSIQINYSPGLNVNTSQKRTSNFNSVSNLYDNLNLALSNDFENTNTTQRAGLTYRYNTTIINFSVGLNYQDVKLENDQSFPLDTVRNKSFYNFLPNAMLGIRFSKSSNLRFFYRTSTSIPSVSQLQSVLNNNNPLQLSIGNFDLKQSFVHNISARYRFANTERGSTFFAFLGFNYINDGIANATYLASSNTRTVEGTGIILGPGVQLTRPVNVDGNMSLSTFLTYGFPVKKLKSNLNINAGSAYTRSPSMVNDNINIANTYNFNGGLVLSSNISKEIDFNIGYSGNYNLVENTIQTRSNNNYYNHIAYFRFNLMPWKGLVLTSDFTNTLYRGLASFNTNYFLWSPAIAYKFLPKRTLEVRLSTFDILDQNTSINRNINSTYLEDTRTTVLRRFFMLTLTYNLRIYTKAKRESEEN